MSLSFKVFRQYSKTLALTLNKVLPRFISCGIKAYKLCSRMYILLCLKGKLGKELRFWSFQSESPTSPAWEKREPETS